MYKIIDNTKSINKELKKFDLSQKNVLVLKPGIYEENIDLLPNVTIEGTGVADLGYTTILGSHLFPDSGSIGFKDIKFKNDSDIFGDRPKGDATFLFGGCCLECKKGYPFSISEMRGCGILFDCWIHGESQGFIYNKGGMKFKIYNMTSESEKNEVCMVVSNKTLFFNVHITHDIKGMRDIDDLNFKGGCWIEGTVIE